MTTATTTEIRVPRGTWTVDRRTPTPTSRSSTPASRSFAAASSRSTRNSSSPTTARARGRRQGRHDHDRRREHPSAPALAGLLRRRAQPRHHVPLDGGHRRRRRPHRPRRPRPGGRLAAGHRARTGTRAGRGPDRREARALARDDDRPHRIRHDLADGDAERRPALGNDVKLIVDLEFARRRPSRCASSRSPAA